MYFIALLFGREKNRTADSNAPRPLKVYSFDVRKDGKSESVSVNAPDTQSAKEIIKEQYPGYTTTFIGQVIYSSRSNK